MFRVWGFGVKGLRVWGFRGLGFGGPGFRGLGLSRFLPHWQMHQSWRLLMRFHELDRQPSPKVGPLNCENS